MEEETFHQSMSKIIQYSRYFPLQLSPVCRLASFGYKNSSSTLGWYSCQSHHNYKFYLPAHLNFHCPKKAMFLKDMMNNLEKFINCCFYLAFVEPYGFRIVSSSDQPVAAQARAIDRIFEILIVGAKPRHSRQTAGAKQ